MTYSFELLPDEPILISTFHDSYSLKRDFESWNKDLLSQLNDANQPICLISDVRVIKVNIFQDFLVAVNKGTRGMETAVDHPNHLITIVVTKSDLMKLAMKGLKSEAFGNLYVPVFDTLDEALAHARELIAQA